IELVGVAAANLQWLTVAEVEVGGIVAADDDVGGVHLGWWLIDFLIGVEPLISAASLAVVRPAAPSATHGGRDIRDGGRRASRQHRVVAVVHRTDSSREIGSGCSRTGNRDGCAR